MMPYVPISAYGCRLCAQYGEHEDFDFLRVRLGKVLLFVMVMYRGWVRPTRHLIFWLWR